MMLPGYLFAYTHHNALNDVVSLILKENYTQALEECYTLQENLDSSLKGELFYFQGVCCMRLGDYEDARKVFKNALSFAEKEDLSTELYMGIADSYFMRQEYSKAIVIYEQLLEKTKNDEAYLAALYYKLGKSYQKESEWAKTKYYFSLLEEKFPHSFEVELVKKSSVGGNFFTIQVGCFSNFKNAEKLQSDLKTRGYEVYITPFKGNGQQLYRVRVGEFVTRLAAEHIEAELRTQEHLPTHIFP
ncbi:MAG: SPOR domain-containing protein [Candidatus Omnitrophica bacterium]|nr:SPOR domain-containing protein [Candidatus Omnitrophota bacterium]